MTINEPAVSGGSTDQHVTGADEESTYLTDKAPTSHTPAHGSSHAGINKLHTNNESEMRL
jgi:hypothetical protein